MASPVPHSSPLGSHRPIEKKRGDLIFHAGSSQVPGSTWGMGVVQDCLQPSEHVCGILGFCFSNRHAHRQIKATTPSAQTFSEPWRYFPFLTVDSSGLYYTRFRTWQRGREVLFTGSLQRLWHLVYSLGATRNKKGVQRWGRKYSWR